MQRLLQALAPLFFFLLLLFVWQGDALAHAAADVADACPPRIVSSQAIRSATPAPPAADAGWQDVALPDNWRARWPGYDGSVWYRIDWRQECANPNTTPGTNPAATPVALTIDSISMAGEVFINDELIWRDRHLVEPLSRSWASPRYWLLPASALRADGANTLWVRVIGVAEFSPGLGVIAFGPPQTMLAVHDGNLWRARTLTMLNAVVSAMLGFLALLVWLYGRRHGPLGWYALVSFCWVLICLLMQATETRPFANSLALAQVSDLIYITYIASFCVFTWRLIDWPAPARLEKALAALTAGAALALFLLPGWSTGQTITHGFSLLFMLNTLHIARQALRTRHREHLIVAACLLLVLAIVVRDVLVLLGAWHSRDFYGMYTSLLFLVLAGVLIRLRMLRDARRIASFNQELGVSVERARSELRAALEHEHALALNNAQLQERLHLARDLHDGLGGQIVRSIMLVEQGQSSPEQQRFLSMLKLLRDDLRQIVDSGASANAADPPTPEVWAAPLRHRFSNLFDELGIAVKWQLPQDWPAAPGALPALLLARVVEEALTNVVKHSRARQVTISLDDAPDPGRCLRLRIEDDGVGFDVDLVRQAGFGVGMLSMRARMQRLGGRLEVRSAPGATIITAILPLGRAG